MADKINNCKDDLFYNDLIYIIKKIAKLKYSIDLAVEHRIKDRMDNIKNDDNSIKKMGISLFEEELFQFANDISNKVGLEFRSINDISMYPSLVEEKIIEYEFYKKKHIDIKSKILR